jgi:hypothetical protein
MEVRDNEVSREYKNEERDNLKNRESERERERQLEIFDIYLYGARWTKR